MPSARLIAPRRSASDLRAEAIASFIGSDVDPVGDFDVDLDDVRVHVEQAR